MSMPINVHLAFQGLSQFKEKYHAMPKPWDNVNIISNFLLFFSIISSFKSDAEKFYELTYKINCKVSNQPITEELNKHWIELFSKISIGDLCPIQSVIGGMVAQEIIKVCFMKLIYDFSYVCTVRV